MLNKASRSNKTANNCFCSINTGPSKICNENFTKDISNVGAGDNLIGF